MGKLTQERLKELLSYDPETGVFIRTMSKCKANIGSIAGCINTDGYRQIEVDGKKYRASRLAWLYMKGYLPEYEVDHENRIRKDDRWINLRHVSRLCNSRNCNIFKNNKSGITGVSWETKRQRWRADIRIYKKLIHLGRFRSKINAVIARWRAEIKYNFPDCSSTSSAYTYLKERDAKVLRAL